MNEDDGLGGNMEDGSLGQKCEGCLIRQISVKPYFRGDINSFIHILFKGGLLAKSRKLFFQGKSFLEGKIQKMQKKISKNFIVSNTSIGHTDHLQTYKGHIEHVGFT